MSGRHLPPRSRDSSHILLSPQRRTGRPLSAPRRLGSPQGTPGSPLNRRPSSPKRRPSSSNRSSSSSKMRPSSSNRRPSSPNRRPSSSHWGPRVTGGARRSSPPRRQSPRRRSRSPQRWQLSPGGPLRPSSSAARQQGSSSSGRSLQSQQPGEHSTGEGEVREVRKPTTAVPILVSDLAPPPDLTLHLLEGGWRKFWSKRWSQGYYFNVKTGQTLWNLTEVVAATVAGHSEECKEVPDGESKINAEVKIK